MAKKSILVVEDDRSIRETIQAVLEMEGYEVSTAENGAEGFRLLAQHEQPGLILLDLMMPVMDGWEFIREFRADPRMASVPVVILTASGLAQAPEGATAMMPKPLEIDHLVRLAETYCHACA